ncbi:MAG: tetratricopeptide repeat protein [Myxococcales bacterium]|nr:tetratricopeptide repeat protein [Myxococcales bacterium]
MRPEPASTNLRPAPTPLVGRADELRQLAELVGAGQRLVTIFGPAGTGKTRTAIALGERLLDDYAGLGGLWLCELAAVRDLEGLCETIARTLGVPPLPAGSDEEIVRRLGAALADRGPLLLVLDNLEQLVALAPSTLAVWLAEAPELRLVVTSREHLRLRGELRFELPPLALPQAGQDAADSEAVALLVDRIRALDPGFALDPETTPLVVDLVTRLEGLPLAIELAASQVELLGLRGLLDELHRRLDVLVGEDRDQDDRHSTLRAAIHWSWELLDEVEQAVLAQCTVFRGGFTAEAAGRVLRVPDGRAPLVVLRALRGKSLLRRDEPEGGARPRFSLLEVVRQFAREQLAAPEAAQAHDRHMAWVLERAELGMAEVSTPRGPRALQELALERANLLAAHEHAMASAAADDAALESALRLCLALDTIASIRGPFAAHLELLERTVAVAEGRAVPPTVRVRALRARAKARLMHGQGAAAERDLEAALEHATAAGDGALQAEVLADQGVWHHQRRELEPARALYDRAVALAREGGARAIEGRVLGNLGALAHDRGELGEARGRYQEALEVLHALGDPRLEAIHVGNLGVLELEHGGAERARAHLDAARELLEPLGDRRLLAIVLGNLGTLEHLQGRGPEAQRCHEEALAILREVGDRRSEALCLSRLARVKAALGWIDGARGCLGAADRLLGRFTDEMASATVDLDRAFVELALARGAEGDERAGLLARVRERMAAVGRPQGEAPPWVERSDDVRFALRLLEQGLGELEAESPGTVEAEPASYSEAAVLVGREARWLQLPGGKSHDLRKRKSMRLILERLAREHLERPGAGLPLEVLLEAGWPGEKVMPSAGANRVYVALTGLRKLGLRKLLLSRDDGYLLDPAVPVQQLAVDWDQRPSPR